MRALVYAANREYAGSCTWDTPSAIDVTAEDHDRGVAYIPCRDCCGTGHFPVPWDAREQPGSDFCVKCKGQGLEPVMV